MTGKAMDVHMTEKLLEIEVGKDEHGGTMRCYVPCEFLVGAAVDVKRYMQIGE